MATILDAKHLPIGWRVPQGEGAANLESGISGKGFKVKLLAHRGRLSTTAVSAHRRLAERVPLRLKMINILNLELGVSACTNKIPRHFEYEYSI